MRTERTERFPSRRSAVVLSALSVAGAGVAPAHDLWLEPSSYRVEPGDPVAVTLRVGEGFRGEPVPRDESRLLELAALGPGGSTPLAGVDGASPAGVGRPPGPGTSTLVYRNSPAYLVLPAGKFEEYLRREGLERIVRLREERGEAADPGRERYSRCAKALVRVGGPPAEARPRPGARPVARPVGCPVELVPLGDPTAMAPGRLLPLRVEARGRPAAGVLVVAYPDAAPRHPIAARTGADGRVALRLDRPGAWLVRAVHMERAAPGGGVEWESWWMSLTFEVAGDW